MTIEAPTLRSTTKVLGGVRADEMGWDANPVAGCDRWSFCWVSRRPPDVDGVQIPATDPECNRRDSGNITDIRARRSAQMAGRHI